MANITKINGNLIDAATASLATTASYAVTAQNVLGSITSASYAATASLLLGSVQSASFASTASFVNTLNQNVNVTGGVSASSYLYSSNNVVAAVNLVSNFSSGDEGGEIQLSRPQTNSSISGSVVIDVNGNRLRIFESNSPNRGGYYDITALASGVGTNLLSGGGGATFNGGTNVDNRLITATGTSPELNGESNLTFNGSTLAVTGNITATSITSSFTGSLTGALVGTSSWATNAINAQTASFLPLGTYSITSSWAQSASNAINAQTASFLPLGTYAVTSSWAVSASQAVSASIAVTASFAISASWAPNTGGTPGGTVNEVQYNDGAGGFAGATNVEISAEGNLNLMAQSDPATPAAGTLALYSKTIAGRIVPKVKGASGLDYALQASFWQNAIYIWNTTGATAGLWINTAGQGAGTFQATNPTTSGGTVYTVQKRSRYSNVVNTANQVLGQRNTDAVFFRGAAANLGGFFFFARCGFDTWTNGGRFFAGMATATTVISADPSALNNTVGFCVDAADNGAISFLTRGTSATKQATGLTITTGKGYDVFIFCKPNDTQISYRIVDLNTGTEYSNIATLTLPSNTTALTANVLASNAAVTPANSIQLGISRIYIETDY